MVNEIDYSRLDRIIHRLAFTGSIQLAAADIESRTLSSHYSDYQAKRPVFITSLPRAGTTLLLEVLSRLPSLATHTYRDMPFVMAPVLWSISSKRFRRRSRLQERAHRDGMQVGYDSPEAFEEIIWRSFWPDKYGANRISLWSAGDVVDEAGDFFREHFKKIVALRRPGRKRDGRYLSKNNGNLSRLDLIPSLFPDASIVVPIRRPVEHARSLLRQHRNFSQLHESHSFVQRYMEDIGHYDFGRLHRPIDFPNVNVLLEDRDPFTLDYWLAYWVGAFEFVMSRVEKLILVSYEQNCAHGREALSLLCRKLELDDQGALDQAASLFRPPSAGSVEGEATDRQLLDRAVAVYEQLLLFIFKG